MNLKEKEELKIKMYDALADVVFEMQVKEGVAVTKNDMQETFEWFFKLLL